MGNGSYSDVFLITRTISLSGADYPDEPFMVVDNPDEALRLINDLNNGYDSINYPFYQYGFQAVPFKHRN